MFSLLTLVCVITSFGCVKAQNFPTAVESVVAINFSNPYYYYYYNYYYYYYYDPGSTNYISAQSNIFQGMSTTFLQYNLTLYDMKFNYWPLYTNIQVFFTISSTTSQDYNSVYNLLAPFFQSAFYNISINSTISSLTVWNIYSYYDSQTGQKFAINVNLNCQLYFLWDPNYINPSNVPYSAFSNLITQSLNGYLAPYGMTVKGMDYIYVWYNNWGVTYKFNLLSWTPQTSFGLAQAVETVVAQGPYYYYWYNSYPNYYAINNVNIIYNDSPIKYPVWYVPPYQSQFTAQINCTIQSFNYYSWYSTSINTNDTAYQQLLNSIAAFIRYGIQMGIPGKVSITNTTLQNAATTAYLLFIITTNSSYDYNPVYRLSDNFIDPFKGSTFGSLSFSNLYISTATSNSWPGFYGVPGETQFAYAFFGNFIYPANDNGFLNFLNSKAQRVSLPQGFVFRTTVIQGSWPYSYNITATITAQTEASMDSLTAKSNLQIALQNWLSNNNLMALSVNNVQMSNNFGVAPMQYGEAVYAVKLNWCTNAPYKNSYSDPNSVDSLTFQQNAFANFLKNIPQNLGAGVRILRTTKLGLGTSQTPC